MNNPRKQVNFLVSEQGPAAPVLGDARGCPPKSVVAFPCGVGRGMRGSGLSLTDQRCSRET